MPHIDTGRLYLPEVFVPITDVQRVIGPFGMSIYVKSGTVIIVIKTVKMICDREWFFII